MLVNRRPGSFGQQPAVDCLEDPFSFLFGQVAFADAVEEEVVVIPVQAVYPFLFGRIPFAGTLLEEEFEASARVEIYSAITPSLSNNASAEVAFSAAAQPEVAWVVAGSGQVEILSEAHPTVIVLVSGEAIIAFSASCTPTSAAQAQAQTEFFGEVRYEFEALSDVIFEASAIPSLRILALSTPEHAGSSAIAAALIASGTISFEASALSSLAVQAYSETAFFGVAKTCVGAFSQASISWEGLVAVTLAVHAFSAHIVSGWSASAVATSCLSVVIFAGRASAIRAIRARSSVEFRARIVGVALKAKAGSFVSHRALSIVKLAVLARAKFEFSGSVGVIPPQFFRFYECKLLVGGVDLSSRVMNWELRFDFDAGAWTLHVEFINHAKLVEQGLGLAPWDPISVYNANGPLLGQYNPVRLYVRPVGSGTWTFLFNGYAGPTAVESSETWGEGDTVRASFVGPSQVLKDWQIEERLALRYTDAHISAAAYPNDLLNQIVRDQGFNLRIYYKDDPSFFVQEYIISNVSLWQALENALAPTGFRLVEWLDQAAGEIRIMVVDPLRFRTEPDVIIRRFKARRITGNEADVRTWVAVSYRDRIDFQEKLVFAESAEALAKYGIPDGAGGRKHRKMVYVTSERSLIDTESEARELAAKILWDLETPNPSLEIEIPWLELFYRPFQLAECIGENFSTLMGIQSITWKWSWERPVGETRLEGCAGRVVGAKNLWFARDTRRALNREVIMLEELAEGPSGEAFSRPMAAGAWYAHQDGSPMPVVDLVFPSPPVWARGIYLKLYRLELKDSALVLSSTKTQVIVSGKNYPNGIFRGPFGDYLLIGNGDMRGQMFKINTVSGNTIHLGESLDKPLSPNTLVMIVRVKRIETKVLPLVRFHRLDDVVEGELIAVSFAWRSR